MRYVEITKKEFDDRLQSKKGWIRNIVGNEFVYDFHLKKYPIIIKVASSIMVDSLKARNKGSDAIRVFAVIKDSTDKDAKVISGLLKSVSVYRTTNWRHNLEKRVLEAINKAKYVYEKRTKWGY